MINEGLEVRGTDIVDSCSTDIVDSCISLKRPDVVKPSVKSCTLVDYCGFKKMIF